MNQYFSYAMMESRPPRRIRVRQLAKHRFRQWLTSARQVLWMNPSYTYLPKSYPSSLWLKHFGSSKHRVVNSGKLEYSILSDHELMTSLPQLSNKILACTCPLTEYCPADTLIKIYKDKVDDIKRLLRAAMEITDTGTQTGAGEGNVEDDGNNGNKNNNDEKEDEKDNAEEDEKDGAEEKMMSSRATRPWTPESEIDDEEDDEEDDEDESSNILDEDEIQFLVCGLRKDDQRMGDILMRRKLRRRSTVHLFNRETQYHTGQVLVKFKDSEYASWEPLSVMDCRNNRSTYEQLEYVFIPPNFTGGSVPPGLLRRFTEAHDEMEGVERRGEEGQRDNGGGGVGAGEGDDSGVGGVDVVDGPTYDDCPRLQICKKIIEDISSDLKLRQDIDTMVEKFYLERRRHPFHILAKTKNLQGCFWDYHENVINDAALEAIMLHSTDYYHPLTELELLPASRSVW